MEFPLNDMLSNDKPDFNEIDYDKIIKKYSQIKRNFGKI